MSELIVNTISGLSDLSVGNSTVNTAITSSGITQNGDNISPVQSFRNKIINGNFDFWQRGTTGTSGYVADRWRTNVGGSTAAISRQSFTLGQIDVLNEPSYFHRVVVTSVAGASNYCFLYQAIESVRTLAGQTATLSFWAKADASKNIAIEGIQYFGTGGSPSTQVNEIDVTTCALTTSWQKFTVTFNFPSISGKTLGTNNDDSLRLYFWLDAGSDYNSRTNSLGQQSGTFDIAQVQLEAGSVATPFEMRPLGTELALCQRYYLKTFDQSVAPAQNAGRNGSLRAYAWTTAAISVPIGITWQYPVEMRSNPTITTFNPNNTNSSWRNNGNSGDATAATSDIGTRNALIYISATLGGTDSFVINATASAEL